MKRVCRRSYNHCMWEWRRWVRESGHPGLRYFLLHIVCRETSGRAAFQRIFSTVYIYFFYFLLRIVCRKKNCRGALPRNFSFSILLFSLLFLLSSPHCLSWNNWASHISKNFLFLLFFLYYFYFLPRIVCRETSGRAMFQLLEPLWTSVSLLSFLSMMAQTTYFLCVGRFAYKRNLPPSLPPFLICVSVPSNCRSLLQDMWGIPQCPTGASNKPFSYRNIKCNGSATGMTR